MIFELIYKYLNNEATEDEVAQVFDWIESSQDNKKTFIAVKKEWIMNSYTNTSNEKVWKYFRKNHLKLVKKRPFKIWKYAAVLIVFIGLVKTVSVLTSSKNIPVGNVVLELNNGEVDLIKDKENKTFIDSKGHIIAEQHNNEIIYHQTETAIKEITYHTITIPYGKTFKVTLSDGTIAHLNSGTTFKYPEQFISKNSRNVFLTGEAFFEVAKDEQHPFIVHSNQVNVEVLGTKFNLSAYPDEATTHCELVEGSVRLSESANPENNAVLEPNHKSTWNNSSRQFETENVDVKLYTAWVYGELMFQNETFENIVKKLERSYNVKITNNNILLANQHFTGTIKIEESGIESVLDLFKLDTPFKYEVDKNSIQITNPK